jgi:hypothetical protein
VIPAHAQAVLDDMAVIRQRLDDAEAAIRAVYSDAVLTSDAGPVRAAATEVVHPQPSKRRTEPEAVAESLKPRPVVASQPTRGSKHDAGILRALKQESAFLGLSLSDVCRALVGPGKPAEVNKVSGGVHQALASLIKRGMVRKDGRFYHIVRDADRASA